jgi:phosphoserine aminotransferase
MLPEPVLKIAAEEMLDYQGSGQSVMEMSHRSAVYEPIIFGCETILRRVMKIPDNYKVLFMQGGASSQFAMVPLNLMNGSGRADYVITGEFAKKAFAEGSRFGKCTAVASSADKTFSYIPELDPSTFDKDADYFYICQNNTIFGSRFTKLPETGNVPLVADMSSCILSEPVDVSKYGLIFAGAQKNMAPAGLTVAIIREDLIGHARENTPTMFNYKTFADNQSMFNTPPCYPIYICKLVLEWIEELGGLEKMAEINREKAAILYKYLDESTMFHGAVQKEFRSLMNVTFVAGSDELNKKFVKEAEAAGFVNLKGHRSVGGMRASIYNAMPVQGLKDLVAFMKDFESKNA